MVVDNVSLGAEKDGRDGQKEGGEEVEPSCWCILWGPRQSKINHSNSPHQGPPTENEKTNRSESQSLSNWTSKGEEELLSSSLLRKFSFNDLKVATRNFRPDSLLGEGGFGSVFKGWIDEHGTAPVKPGTGLTVAVKILNQSGLQGHQEWLAELNFLGQLSHPNLVKLFGYCIENDQRLLVYEFLQKGSLENHLFRRGAMPIPWSTRLSIALNAAKGLAFLHSGEKQPIIYRDFKSSNILLDSDFNAKLSDFGLARDGPAGDKSHVSTRVLGTYGYAAPEYVMTGHLTTKSDVYSYGVVLLELMTGKRCMDKRRPSGQHNLVGWVRPQLNDKKKLYKILDPGLDGQYTTKALKTLAYLAYRCTSRDTKSRPSMAEVVGILESLVETTNKDLTNTNNINYPSVTHYPPSPLLGPRNGFNDTLSVVPEDSESTRPPYQQSIQRPSVDNTDK